VQAEKKRALILVEDSQTRLNNHLWTYTWPGHINTNCASTSNINGTPMATGAGTAMVSGSVDTQTNCASTSTPAQTKTLNFATAQNLVVAVDMQRGQQYLLECTAHWRGSQCHGLLNGYFNAFIENDTVTVNVRNRGKNMEIKYYVLQVIAGVPPTSVGFVPEITAEMVEAMWRIYSRLSDEDKKYVTSFCTANQNLIAFTPQDKVKAGQDAEHALDCTNWNRARKVYEQ
jgi:hypothetical protein